MIPCELMVSRVLPVIRSVAASRLAKTKKQKEIAEELGITEAAVSHYLSKRRGNYGGVVGKAVAKSVDKFIGKKMPHAEKVCAVCRDLRSSGALCAIHAEKNPSFDVRGCMICRNAC
ncbi:MAG: hypothetical protein NTY90_02765 [Candidatus Micrarchaeota archaeon]|nr:hypothetical protein [Candidatus Micrarchaeota archaeon]